jgi:hypothetical protein
VGLLWRLHEEAVGLGPMWEVLGESRAAVETLKHQAVDQQVAGQID